jgi:hypothetical protein
MKGEQLGINVCYFALSCPFVTVMDYVKLTNGAEFACNFLFVNQCNALLVQRVKTIDDASFSRISRTMTLALNCVASLTFAKTARFRTYLFYFRIYAGLWLLGYLSLTPERRVKICTVIQRRSRTFMTWIRAWYFTNPEFSDTVT